jgi:chromosomal replication initiator protein
MAGTAKRIWETCLGQLQLQIPRPSYDTWFKGTSGVALEGDHLEIAVPTTFAAEWLERRMYQLIERTVAGVAGRSIRVSFKVSPPTPESGFSAEHDADQPSSLRVDDGGQAPSITMKNGTHNVAHPLNHRYTFDTFVIGNNNQLAYAAASAVAEKPGNAYNPLFIYSGVGLGKTHLLHAIASAVLQRNLRPLYVTTEQFTNEFIQAIRERKTDDFRAKYRSADVLLLDDIQFLAGKEQTQEGFFHTFNELHNSNRQIVIACDMPPRAVSRMEERLCSRFEWGLVADIQPPDWETRLAIIYKKAASQGVAVPAAAAEEIARLARHSVRELEGYLNRVLALSQFLGVEITAPLVESALAAVAPSTSAPRVMPEKAIAIIANHYSILPSELCSRPLDKRTTHAQRVTMYLLRDVLGLPSQAVAEQLGRWTKRTVANSVAQISHMAKEDTSLQREILQIKGLLGVESAA